MGLLIGWPIITCMYVKVISEQHVSLMIVQWQILSSGGGYYEVIKAHCSFSWGEFRKPLPIKHILTVRADAFSPCVRSAMLYGWENCASNVSELQLLQRNDRVIDRWICRIKLGDNVHTDVLLRFIGVVNISECSRKVVS